LQQYSSGLVCLTGGDEGPLASALLTGGEAAGRELLQRLVRIFGPRNVFVELQRHHEREEEWRNQAAMRSSSLRMSVTGEATPPLGLEEPAIPCPANAGGHVREKVGPSMEGPDDGPVGAHSRALLL